jgi:enamine deaminase RidA (YjgF/YER057c/UK114 family)
MGAPARSAIGVNALPGNIPVETEALFEIEE